MIYRKKPISVFLLFLFVFCSLFASANFKSLDDFSGHTFALEQGSVFADIVDKYYKDNGPQDIRYFNSAADCIVSLMSNRSDVILNDLPIAEYIAATYDELTVFPEHYNVDNYGFAFAKDSPLKAEFDKAIAKIKAQGIDKDLHAKWFAKNGNLQKHIVQDWQGSKGTLRFWGSSIGIPMCFVGEDGELNGYTIDYALCIAKELDYKLEFTECYFSGVIPALVSGKADIGGCAISITEERKKTVDFSEPYYVGAVSAVVRKSDLAPELLPGGMNTERKEKKSFFDSLSLSFKRTFVEESRWKLFAIGLLRTLGITVFSALLGTTLGFIFYMVFRKTSIRLSNTVSMIFGFITGIPTVVLVMIFFYLFFAKTRISGFAVSIFALSLVFGISVYSMIKHGIDTLNSTQTEGAYALGFSDRETFFYVLLPQAIRNVFSLYSDELVNLIKGSAIVGYIAVVDLTKASDLVRAKTFDAFFSLVVTALIYYFFERFLVKIVVIIKEKTNPFARTEKQILKGIIR